MIKEDMNSRKYKQAGWESIWLSRLLRSVTIKQNSALFERHILPLRVGALFFPFLVNIFHSLAQKRELPPMIFANHFDCAGSNRKNNLRQSLIKIRVIEEFEQNSCLRQNLALPNLVSR